METVKVGNIVRNRNRVGYYIVVKVGAEWATLKHMDVGYRLRPGFYKLTISQFENNDGGQWLTNGIPSPA